MPSQDEFIQKQMDDAADKDRIAWVTDEKTHTSLTDGNTIIERSYGGDIVKDDPKEVYWGVGAIMLNMQTPQGVHQQPHEFTFPIKAKDLKDAFSRFASTLREAQKKEGERLQKRIEAERNRIVTARTAPGGKVLVAS